MTLGAVRSYSADRLLSLVCGMAPLMRKRCKLLMLKAYIDDSGRGQGPAFVLSGYLATAEEWAAFSEEWGAELAVEPSIKYFKMKEAASGRGQFEGHKRELIDFRISKLVSIIERHEIRGITVALDSDAFTEVMLPYFTPLTLPGDAVKMLTNPYFHCFYQLIVVLLTAQQQTGVIEPIDFIFDNQGKEGREIREHWYVLRNMPSPNDGELREMLVGEPTFDDDKRMMPLQAADLSAWQYRNFMNALADSQDEHFAPNPIMARLGEIPHVEYVIGYKQCRAMIAQFAQSGLGVF
jgi:hypothetical protein